VLVYDQDKDALGEGKFNPMWFGPYVVRWVLEKGSYELWILKEMCCQSPEMGST
jgi:hypothetical protein